MSDTFVVGEGLGKPRVSLSDLVRQRRSLEELHAAIEACGMGHLFSAYLATADGSGEPQPTTTAPLPARALTFSTQDIGLRWRV